MLHCSAESACGIVSCCRERRIGFLQGLRLRIRCGKKRIRLLPREEREGRRRGGKGGKKGWKRKGNRGKKGDGGKREGWKGSLCLFSRWREAFSVSSRSSASSMAAEEFRQTENGQWVREVREIKKKSRIQKETGRRKSIQGTGFFLFCGEPVRIPHERQNAQRPAFPGK